MKLDNMTQEHWDSLAPAERDALRDKSALHPKLIGFEGNRISCLRDGKRRTFRVGISTGWKPIHLAMRGDARGSSDVIGADEAIAEIRLEG